MLMLAKIADGHFVAARVQLDLGAEIRIVNYAAVVLRVADVRRILPGHPRMSGLEEHLEHPLPEREHAHFAAPELCLLRPGRS